jgi:hypothetical protein
MAQIRAMNVFSDLESITGIPGIVGISTLHEGE